MEKTVTYLVEPGERWILNIPVRGTKQGERAQKAIKHFRAFKPLRFYAIITCGHVVFPVQCSIDRKNKFSEDCKKLGVKYMNVLHPYTGRVERVYPPQAAKIKHTLQFSDFIQP